MPVLIALWRLLRLKLHIAHGLWVVHVRFQSADARARQAYVQWWSAKVLRLFGITLQSSGSAQPGAKLVIANHVSWLDIAAIHALMPEARFVSKADVKLWPLVGALVSAAGTLYIERASKRDARRVVHQTADALKAGDTVAVFPEGTTGAGPELLPFHANLLQAAISAGSVIQPVVLRWHTPEERFATPAQFIGQTTLLQSVWMLACARNLSVSVQLLPAEPPTLDRRELAETLRAEIAAALKN
ncbi:MAG TPA: lysophospholipid acyltransferase family protein [Burkholderiaceae bacterium]